MSNMSITNVCTKQLLLQVRQLEVPTDADMEGCGDPPVYRPSLVLLQCLLLELYLKGENKTISLEQ